MENRKVVWALFDDGEQSVFNSLDKDKYQVISFGILEKDTVETMDLSWDINNILYRLEYNYPKPDYIVASPPCIAFSKASGIEKGKNAYLYYDDLREREREDYINSMYKFDNSPIKGKTKKDFAILSKIIVLNTLEIIKYFKPTAWYIENPRLSLIWNYINDDLNYHNIVNYGSYNYPIKKPTIFLSNKELNLKTDVKGKTFLKWDKEFTNKSKRSGIPKELIIDIFNKFE